LPSWPTPSFRLRYVPSLAFATSCVIFTPRRVLELQFFPSAFRCFFLREFIAFKGRMPFCFFSLSFRCPHSVHDSSLFPLLFIFSFTLRIVTVGTFSSKPLQSPNSASIFRWLIFPFCFYAFFTVVVVVLGEIVPPSLHSFILLGFCALSPTVAIAATRFVSASSFTTKSDSPENQR